MLRINDLGSYTDAQLLRLGANTDYCEGIYEAEFSDGSKMCFDLCSGQHNYFDDVVWRSPNGDCDVTLDCEYILDDIEVEISSNIYIVEIIKV